MGVFVEMETIKFGIRLAGVAIILQQIEIRVQRSFLFVETGCSILSYTN